MTEATVNGLNIDITSLSSEQLDLLEKIAPEAVASEKARRTSFNNMEEALTVVFQAKADLDARFAAMKASPAAKELKASGIFEALTRFENFAKLNEMPFTAPTVPTYVKPALKKGGTEGAAPEASEQQQPQPETTEAPPSTEAPVENTEAPVEEGSARGRRKSAGE